MNVESKTLVATMAATLTKEKADSLCKQLNDVQANALVNTLLDMRKDFRGQDTWQITELCGDQGKI